MKRIAKNSSAAFTLLEILLVIVIIVALMTALLSTLRNKVAEAKSGQAEIYVNQLSSELALYEASNGRPPTTQQGLAALVQKPTTDPIPRRWSKKLDKIEPDPWGKEYLYEYPGKHNPLSFDIYSAGPDGTPGNEDDIGNWK